ncbi:diacylglycerol kinase family protein [Mycobacterium sp. E2733]|uniref:diacylglycerol kinase family protein n=1 Tax=Mycobacterium sp. E2733 TaxID=1834138 RepID=UPI000800428D|nr:diacylglycerol kinase family protein [Mycobacterium sp. E2733]OBI00520.1 retinol dehydrogenase [Mycobacterium sp. E2733]
MYLGVIVNPRSRKNRAASRGRSADLRRIVGHCGEVHETASLADLRTTVERLYPRASHLVSDGGDGALHWLINEMRLCVADPESWPTFVPTTGGTINFVARKASVHGRTDSILRTLTAAAEGDRPPPEMSLDTLELDGEAADGAAFHRVGFALAAGGVGNRFFDRYYERPNPGPATVARVIARGIGDYATSKLLPRRADRSDYASHLFNPTHARVTIDGEEVPTRNHRALNAGAFDLSLGGVFRLFPKAREPGAPHFQAGEMSPAKIIAHLPALIVGGTIRGDLLRDVNGREMIIEAEDEPLAPIIDGERFVGIQRLVVRAGPRIRIAQVGRRLRRCEPPLRADKT